MFNIIVFERGEGMICFKCEKLTGDYDTDKMTCACCREALKIDIVRILRGMDRVYLSEGNRNKAGRKRKLTADERNDIKYVYKTGTSMGELARRYQVSKGTIFNIVHG